MNNNNNKTSFAGSGVSCRCDAFDVIILKHKKKKRRRIILSSPSSRRIKFTV